MQETITKSKNSLILSNSFDRENTKNLVGVWLPNPREVGVTR